MDAESTKAGTEWGAEGAAIRVGVLTFGRLDPVLP